MRRDTPTVHSLWTRETGQLSRETLRCRMVVGVTAQLGRWRWRCALCIAFGFATSREVAESEFWRHYYTTHSKESK